MPFYRIDGRMVHMRGTKLSAPCGAPFSFPRADGTFASCLAPSAFLCDWRDAPGASTCDRPLCAIHARAVGRNRHYCPAHQAASPAGRQLGLFTTLVPSNTTAS